jgi:carboxymethylenebutenolidase
MSGTDLELGYLATPSGPSRSGVVIVPDVWGLSATYRTIANRLAEAGHAALALDVHRREQGLSITDVGAFMRDMDDREVLADVQQAVDALHARGAARVAVIGFCMGGMYALLAGAQVERVAAVAPFYGILSHGHGLLDDKLGLDRTKKPTEPLEAAGVLRCPLLGFFGDQDVFVPMSDVVQLRSRLAKSGQAYDVLVYAGAGHAFMNETRPQMYRPEAAAAAWKALLSFLDEHVR